MIEWVEDKAGDDVQYSYAVLSSLVELHCHHNPVSGWLGYVDLPNKRLTLYADTLEAIKTKTIKEARRYLIKLHTDFTTALNKIGDGL